MGPGKIAFQLPWPEQPCAQVCWPSAWLAEDLPQARLLSMEYAAPASGWEVHLRNELLYLINTE